MQCTNCGYVTKTEFQAYYDKILLLIENSYAVKSNDFEWITATNIAKKIGIKNPSVKHARIISACFKELYGTKTGYFRVSGGKRLIKVHHMVETVSQ